MYKYSYVVLDIFTGKYGTLEVNRKLEKGQIFKGYEIIREGKIK